jgi:hypothetical protein
LKEAAQLAAEMEQNARNEQPLEALNARLAELKKLLKLPDSLRQG